MYRILSWNKACFNRSHFSWSLSKPLHFIEYPRKLWKSEEFLYKNSDIFNESNFQICFQTNSSVLSSVTASARFDRKCECLKQVVCSYYMVYGLKLKMKKVSGYHMTKLLTQRLYFVVHVFCLTWGTWFSDKWFIFRLSLFYFVLSRVSGLYLSYWYLSYWYLNFFTEYDFNAQACKLRVTVT